MAGTARLKEFDDHHETCSPAPSESESFSSEPSPHQNKIPFPTMGECVEAPDHLAGDESRVHTLMSRWIFIAVVTMESEPPNHYPHVIRIQNNGVSHQQPANADGIQIHGRIVVFGRHSLATCRRKGSGDRARLASIGRVKGKRTSPLYPQCTAYPVQGVPETLGDQKTPGMLSARQS